MSTNDPIGDYLARLEAASAGLTPPARAELLDDIRAHLAEIEANSVGAAQVLNSLDRLGSPEAIVAAAVSEAPGDVLAPPTPPAEPTTGRIRPLDVLTVLLLVAGTLVLLPFLGPFALVVWPVAVAMLWVSPTWTAGEKTLGTLVWPGGYVLPLATLFLPGQTCTTETMSDSMGLAGGSEQTVCEGFSLPIWLGIPVSVLMLLAPIAVAILLLRRAQRRAA